MQIPLDRLVGGRKIHLFFDLEPAAQEWVHTAESGAEPDGPHTYKCGVYECRLRLSDYRGHRILTFQLERTDARPFTVKGYGVKGTQELVDTLPYTARFDSMDWDFRETSNASTAAKPFILYGSRNGENRFAVGFDDPGVDTEKRIVFEVLGPEDRRTMVSRLGRKAVLTDKEIFSLSRPSDAPHRTRTVEDALFYSTARRSWFHVERDYCAWLDAVSGYEPNSFPESLLGPAWCSWCFTTDIDERTIWENAAAAAELGFRFIIIDAGWYHASSDIVWTDEAMTSEQIGFGRLFPDPRKFPDFAGLIGRIKAELHLGVALWIAPRYLFRPRVEGEKRIDDRLLACRIVNSSGKAVPMLCTRHPASRDHAAALVKNLIRDYDIDGIKIDAWGEAASPSACLADHTHDCTHVGRGIEKWAQAIWESARSVKRDFFVWLDTQGTRRYANYGSIHDEIWCNADAHYIENIRSRTEHTGFPRQACDGGWHPEETEANVARHLAVYMCGLLPELDMDLTVLRAGHKRQIRAWLRFFMDHREDLLEGEFEPLGFESSSNGPYSRAPLPVRITRGTAAYVWMTSHRIDELFLDRDCRTLYLFNLTNRDALDVRIEGMADSGYNVRTRDVYLEQVSDAVVEISGSTRLNLAVPAGGMVELCVESGGRG